MIKPFCQTESRPARAAIFLSGSGSNAEEILKAHRGSSHPPLDIAVLATDRPRTSRALELGEIYDVPVIGVDIRSFYRDHGQKRISIMTPEGRAIREEWTNELRRQLAPHNIDFGIFAGFVPLCNLAADFPCLNVHPGDLTYEINGARHLVGLHTVPVELAMLEGLDYMRSSVIIAEPFEGKGENMDAGHILGISSKVSIDLMGKSHDDIASMAASRPDTRPAKGYCDELESIAEHNQDLLKVGGDWVVFPPVVFAFAEGRFGADENDQLYYRENQEWLAVKTVEFDGSSARPILNT